MTSRDEPTNLKQIQRWMQAVIMHPHGAEAGVQAPRSRQVMNVSVDAVEQIICRSVAQSSVERLQVYANAYYARLLEVLASEYPALAHALGPELFQEFAWGYVQECPSESYTLHDFGRRFPEYLSRTRPERATESAEPDWADFLTDLALLERTYSEVFDGPGVEGQLLLDREALSRIESQHWPDVRLVPVPCLKLLHLRFPAHEYVTAVRRRETPEIPHPAPVWLVVTRRDFVVRRVAVSDVEFAALAVLVSGGTIVESLSAGHARWGGDVEQLAAEVQRWFREWSAAGYFLGLDEEEAAFTGTR